MFKYTYIGVIAGNWNEFVEHYTRVLPKGTLKEGKHTFEDGPIVWIYIRDEYSLGGMELSGIEIIGTGYKFKQLIQEAKLRIR